MAAEAVAEGCVFRPKSRTHSEARRAPLRREAVRCATCRRNGCVAFSGMGARLASERVAGFGRNAHSERYSGDFRRSARITATSLPTCRPRATVVPALPPPMSSPGRRSGGLGRGLSGSRAVRALGFRNFVNTLVLRLDLGTCWRRLARRLEKSADRAIPSRRLDHPRDPRKHQGPAPTREPAPDVRPTWVGRPRLPGCSDRRACSLALDRGTARPREPRRRLPRPRSARLRRTGGTAGRGR